MPQVKTMLSFIMTEPASPSCSLAREPRRPRPLGVFSRKTFQPNSRREVVCLMRSKAYPTWTCVGVGVYVVLETEL